MPKNVSTSILARDLGVSERRVQQLTAEGIFPDPTDGLHDRELCSERFSLYRSKDPDAWADYHAETERLTFEVDLAVNEGPRSAQTPDEIQSAVRSVEALFSRLRFTVLAYDRTDDFSRQCILGRFEQMEKEALGRLVSRALKLTCDEQGISFEACIAGLQAEAAALDGQEARA